MCLQKNCFKYNNKPAHWVGQSKLRFLDIDELFKWTPKFDENQACVTGKTEEEKNTSKKTTDDADTNAEDNKNIHKNREIVVTIEEDRKTSEYQETMNLDIENIASTNLQIWRSTFEVIHDDYFKAR